MSPLLTWSYNDWCFFGVILCVETRGPSRSFLEVQVVSLSVGLESWWFPLPWFVKPSILLGGQGLPSTALGFFVHIWYSLHRKLDFLLEEVLVLFSNRGEFSFHKICQCQVIFRKWAGQLRREDGINEITHEMHVLPSRLIWNIIMLVWKIIFFSKILFFKPTFRIILFDQLVEESR